MAAPLSLTTSEPKTPESSRLAKQIGDDINRLPNNQTQSDTGEKQPKNPAVETYMKSSKRVRAPSDNHDDGDEHTCGLFCAHELCDWCCSNPVCIAIVSVGLICIFGCVTMREQRSHRYRVTEGHTRSEGVCDYGGEGGAELGVDTNANDGERGYCTAGNMTYETGPVLEERYKDDC